MGGGIGDSSHSCSEFLLQIMAGGFFLLQFKNPLFCRSFFFFLFLFFFFFFLVVLAFFKFFIFLVVSFAAGLVWINKKANPPTLDIILPLGISFMTFQGIAYVIDVWRGNHAVEHDLVKFLGFKAFFPQLIAGP